MAPAVRVVAEILNAIKSGSFDPDVTRSERFRPPVAQPWKTKRLMHQMGHMNSRFLDQSKRGCEISDSTTLWELVKPEFRSNLVKVDSNLEKYVHKGSCVLHLRKPEAKRFLCGHILNGRYEAREHGLSAECPRCTTCFNSKDA